MVFEKKTKAHEKEQVLKDELAFKVLARRNKMLGLWVAEQMGLSGDAANTYAKEVVAADLDEPGDADVVRKVMKDFADKGIAMTEARLRQEMETLLPAARKEVEAQQRG